MTLMLLEKPEIENLVVVGVACHERLIVRFMTASKESPSLNAQAMASCPAMADDRD